MSLIFCAMSCRNVFVSVAALAIAGQLAVSGGPISPEQFRELHALIKPKSNEGKWAGIPWRTSLWEARQEAAHEGKPILLWEMDGHPLGCT